MIQSVWQIIGTNLLHIKQVMHQIQHTLKKTPFQSTDIHQLITPPEFLIGLAMHSLIWFNIKYHFLLIFIICSFDVET